MQDRVGRMDMHDQDSKSREGRRRAGLLARFGRNRRGSVAIEFTALAIPFAMLVFAILESCISFAAQQVLSNATDDIARQLRTGQVKAADVNETALKKMICDRLDIVVASGCAAAAAVKIKLTTDGDIDTTGFAVKPGPSMSKNMLRVFYRWPVITDFMRKSMSNLKGGKTLHFATATWQNEPFDD